MDQALTMSMNMRNIKSRRAGLSLLWMVVIFTGVCGFISFGVDYGRVQLAKTQLENAADAASRAAALALGNGYKAAEDAAVAVAAQNLCDGKAVALVKGRDIEFATYDKYAGTYTVLTGSAQNNANCVRILAQRTVASGDPIQLNFAKLIGFNTCDVRSESKVTVLPPGPGYVGLSLTRMFDNTRFDSYDSSKAPYSAATARNKAVLLSMTDIWLHDYATVMGEAHWAPGANLVKDPTATLNPGPLSALKYNLKFDPVNLGTAATVNDNNKLTTYYSGNKISVPKNVTVSYPGGTYYLTQFNVALGASVTFTGTTTIYLNGDSNIEGTVGHTSYKPYMLNIKGYGAASMKIETGGYIHAFIYTPLGDVHHHGGQSFGSVVSDLLCFRTTGQGHYDEAITGGGTSPIISFIK